MIFFGGEGEGERGGSETKEYGVFVKKIFWLFSEMDLN